jgi:hypothetical protein
MLVAALLACLAAPIPLVAQRTGRVEGVVERARGAMGEDENGYRAEFVRLVEGAQALELGKVARR